MEVPVPTVPNQIFLLCKKKQVPQVRINHILENRQNLHLQADGTDHFSLVEINSFKKKDDIF